MHIEFKIVRMSIVKKILLLFIIFKLLLVLLPAGAQENKTTPSNSLAKDSLSIVKTDSITTKHDSIQPKKKATIEAKVDYQSKDSIIMTGDNMFYLFGDGNVKYMDMELKSEYMRVSMDSSIVYATFGLDSIGHEMGYPVFKDGGGEYEAKTMRYNFKTQKGFATDIITQQGEGYVTAGRTKKLKDGILYMVDGKYTTCDEHDHPHFYLNLTKAKVRTGKNIVAGPAYLVIEDVPLPIALPFGYFPFSKSYSSGVIMPTYGDEMTRGFYLRDGGYYFALSDYIDLALTGEIYTKGSWGLNARSTYRKKYKFSGNFNAGYLVTITGDKGIDYNRTEDFKINWNHNQDPKSNPYTVFGASVNFSSTSYDRNQINSIYNSDMYTQNTKASSINITQRFPDSPWSMSANMQISQNSKDSLISMTLPNMTINMSTVFPFRRKQQLGNERWYEKISLSYSGVLTNSIRAKQEELFTSNLLRDWDNKMTHSIPVSATFSAFKYINITPSVNYNEVWSTKKKLKGYDRTRQAVVPTDTIYGFYRTYDFSASLGFNTILYGMYKPWKVFGDKVQAIRHVFTPTFSLSARPNFGSSNFGFYETFTYYDKDGVVHTETYSPYEGAPSAGRASSSLGFGFQNNLEMKVKSDSDSTGVKKISLIDNFSLSGSYDLTADSMRWSDFSVNLRLKFGKNYNISLSGMLDPYTYVPVVNPNTGQVVGGRRANVMRWEAGKGFARLRSTGTSFSYSFNTESVKKLLSIFTGKKAEDEEDKSSGGNGDSNLPNEGMPGEEGDGQQVKAGGLRSAKKDTGEYDQDGYLKNNINWNLSLGYNISLNYDMSRFDPVSCEYPYKITQGLSISGSLSPSKGWNFNFSTNYDFDSKTFPYMNCSISRDLHCWQMTASFIPMGPYKSYNFSIAVKSSLLQDLKYEQRSSPRDAMDWY